MTSTTSGLISFFVRHTNAANLLMAVMILLGILGVSRMSRQVMPSLSVNVVTVSVEWPGAGPEDVDRNVIGPIEQSVRFLQDVEEMESVAFEGRGQVTIVFDSAADMARSLADVQAAVARVSTLPSEASRPVINQLLKDERVSRLEISGPFTEEALQQIARRMRDELLVRGLSRVVITGQRNPEIWVEVRDDALRHLGLTLQQIANRVAQAIRNQPAGNLEVDGQAKLIRSRGAAPDGASLGQIEVISGQFGEKVLLKDIASVSDAFAENSVSQLSEGQTAIGLTILRSTASDSVSAQQVVDDYLADFRRTSPPSLVITQYDKYANVVSEQISSLLVNALQGFALIVIALYAFVRARVAFWVAAGIPVAIMAALGMLSVAEVTINMITMFALIAGLGMVDDEAIVVGERAEALFKAGMPADLAAETAASQMRVPVIASALTTMAAFAPMLAIGGNVGQVIAPIPLTMIFLLAAGVIECLLILPMHLRTALLDEPAAGSRRFPRWFEQFRRGAFTRAVAWCFERPFTTVTLSACLFLLTMTLMASGRVVYEFSPTVEGDMTVATFAFSPGTSRERSRAMIGEIERAAKAAEVRLTAGKGGLVAYRGGVLGGNESSQEFGTAAVAGDHVGSYVVELVGREQRDVHLQEFMQAWSEEIREPAGVEQFAVFEVKVDAAPGRDLRLSIRGADPQIMKRAALALRQELEGMPGVFAVTDDAPYGKQELLLSLTAAGQSMGLTSEGLATQVRHALEGVIAARLPGEDAEVPVRVRLQRSGDDHNPFTSLVVRGPDGTLVPLADVVDVGTRVGPSSLRRINGVPQVSVLADLDTRVTTTSQLVGRLRDTALPAIERDYGVEVEFVGRTTRQARVVAEIGIAFVVALAAMYLIIASALSSYTRPLLVMSVIPFGLAGVVLGHFVGGFNLSYLGLIAFLGFTGVVVNGAIILVSAIDDRIGSGMSLRDAVTHAAPDRLRAILLTTLTTIGSLLPLFMQDSLAADFLKPLAATVVMQLLFSMVTVLLFLPAMLGVANSITSHRARRRTGRTELIA